MVTVTFAEIMAEKLDMTVFFSLPLSKLRTVTNRGNMESEQKIQNDIRVALSETGNLVFRANVGKVRMSDGRWFDTGLPKGFSDLFGFRSDGQIFFIEVKNQKGRVRPEQKIFLERAKSQGALAGVARSVEDALGIVNGKQN